MGADNAIEGVAARGEMRSKATHAKWSWGLRILILVLLALASIRLYHDLYPNLVRVLNTRPFWDLKVFAEQIDRYENGGKLYDTDRPDWNMPGTPVYKYPPLVAAVLKPLLNVRKPLFKRAQPLVWASLVALGLSLVLTLLILRPGWDRALIGTTGFVAWQGNVETIHGPQFEPFMLLLLVLGLVAIRANRRWITGMAIGIAGGLKVYPWGLAALYVLLRRWRVTLGIVFGALISFALSTLVFPIQLSVRFVTEILPAIGGLGFGYENVSVPGNLGRIAYAIRDTLPSPFDLDYHSMRMTEESGPPGVFSLTWLFLVPVAVVILVVSARAILRRTPAEGTRRDILHYGLGICLLLMLIPTSWINYQTLLTLPFLIALALASPFREDRWTLPCVLIAGAFAAIPEAWPSRPVASAFRSLVPVLLWVAHLRLLAYSRATSTSVGSTSPIGSRLAQ